MNRSRQSQRGSVLIIVLILMTVSVALALYTVSVSRDIVKSSGDLMDNLQARLESGSTLEKLKYVVSTGRFTSWSVQNLSGNKDLPLQLSLRGDVMQVGNSELRLQDSAGKLGIWPPHSAMLGRLLAEDGLKPNDVAVAVDSLSDWVDADDLTHLNGAESYYYRSEAGGAYRPRNDRFIETVQELELIKGVRGRVYDLLKDEVMETATPTFNFNTADARLLSAAFNIDLANARGLVQLRDSKGILARRDVAAAGGNILTFADEYFIPFPSMKVGVDIRTRINDAGDSLHAIVSFRPVKDRPFTVERFDE